MAKAEKTKLNPKQELFCQLYATEREFFGNGTQAYIEAYDVDLTRKGAYGAARAGASELLTKPNILTRIDELLELTLNDQHVDKQLSLVITQNADYSSKVAAIREYNKLKARITEKIDHTSGGKPIPILAPMNVFTHNGDNQNSKPQEANQSDSGGYLSQQDNLDSSATDSPSPDGQEPNADQHSIGVLSSLETRGDAGLPDDPQGA